MSNAALATAPQPLELDIHPVAGRIGAEIRGVQLSADLDAATIEAIRNCTGTAQGDLLPRPDPPG